MTTAPRSTVPPPAAPMMETLRAMLIEPPYVPAATMIESPSAAPASAAAIVAQGSDGDAHECASLPLVLST